MNDKIKKGIETTILMNELQSTNEISDFLKKNIHYMNTPSIAEYLNNLITERGLKKSKVIADTNLTREYGYEILSGKKKKKYNQNILLAFALALHLNIDETQHLLKYGQVSELYPKRERDSIIIFAIKKGFTVIQTDELLAQNGYEDDIISSL